MLGETLGLELIELGSRMIGGEEPRELLFAALGSEGRMVSLFTVRSSKWLTSKGAIIQGLEEVVGPD
jgi:hypothetical protein